MNRSSYRLRFRGPRSAAAALLITLLPLCLFVTAFSADCRADPAYASPRARIADKSGATTVALKVEGVHLYVEGKVNGKPARFLLDTGAGANILTPEAIRRLGISLGDQKVHAQGAGTVEAGLAIIDRIDIGQASLEDESAVILSLPPQLEVDGLLGYGFFNRFVVTLDYDASRMTLTSPKTFHPAPDAAVLPLKINGNIPFFEAEADGIKGIFELDSGAAGSLILFAPFVERNALRARYNPRIETITGRGIGGLLKGELVRMPTLKLGKVVIKSLIAELSQQTSGGFYDKTLAGNIGAGIIRRFTVTTDYSRKKVYLTPNLQFEDPFPQNRSGVAVDLDNFIYSIVAVVKGSPGAEAGIKAGDALLAVNAVGVEKLKSEGIRTAFRRPAGTVLSLLIRSGVSEKPRSVSVTLRDLL